MIEEANQKMSSDKLHARGSFWAACFWRGSACAMCMPGWWRWSVRMLGAIAAVGAADAEIATVSIIEPRRFGGGGSRAKIVTHPTWTLHNAQASP
jgi:hypothetical protein